MPTNNCIDTLPANRNLIVGGDFGLNPWQRGVTFLTLAAPTYTADGFVCVVNGVGRITAGKNTIHPTVSEVGFLTTHNYRLDTATSDATIDSTDVYGLEYRIEGFDFTKIAQRACTLSFWVNSVKTGTFCIALENGGSDRGYVAEYTINTTNTWEYKVIRIPASPPTGTWNYTNGIGLRLRFCLAAGTNFQTTAGSWQTGDFWCTSNQINGMDSTSNAFHLCLIQLESGLIVTSYEKLRQEDLLARCQRYYQKSYNNSDIPGTATTDGAIYGIATLANTNLPVLQPRTKVPMRSAPTIVWYSTIGTAARVIDLTAVMNRVVSSVTGANQYSAGYPVLSLNAVDGNLHAGHYTLDSSL